MKKPITMTVRELKEHLEREVFPYPDAEIYFGAGDLTFNRIKWQQYAKDDKTPVMIQIQFNELYEVTFDPDSDA